ncbi:MAG: IS110 family transposase [Pseudomonadota bacterium]
MNKYSGIDLHSNNCVVVVSDEDDRVCCERRVPNDLAKIVALLEPYRNDLVGVAVESTFNWYWLVDGLSAAGFDVKLVNTAAIAQYSGLKYSGDEYDARHLAHLLRLKLLKFGYVLEPQWRATRDLARKRQQLVRTRTTHVLAFESIFARETGGHISGDAVKALDVVDVLKWGWDEDVTLAAQVNVLAVQAMERGIAILEHRLHERIKLTPEYKVLKTVPGVGEILSTVIMLETGPIERFTSAGNYASYARCVGSGRFSNNKKKGEGNRKNGNSYLAWAFVEAAHFALRYSEAAKRFYDRKRARSNTALATKALAHKLARACYHMLKERTEFDEKRCFA